jgi:hypothetical protein
MLLLWEESFCLYHSKKEESLNIFFKNQRYYSSKLRHACIIPNYISFLYNYKSCLYRSYIYIQFLKSLNDTSVLYKQRHHIVIDLWMKVSHSNQANCLETTITGEDVSTLYQVIVKLKKPRKNHWIISIQSYVFRYKIACTFSKSPQELVGWFACFQNDE